MHLYTQGSYLPICCIMATSGHVKENAIFTCSICLEQLKSPRSLPCLHTFCFQCISEYILSAERHAGHEIAKYTCPVCRTIVTPKNPEQDTTQWIESLPHNFTISVLMETKKEPQTQECHICKRKQKCVSATKWCRDCTEAFCDNCCEMHGLMKLSMSHKVVDIMSIQTNEFGIDLSKISDACPVHSSKVVEAYCFDHQQLCCVLCVTLQHRKCEDVQAIEDITSRKTDKDSFEANLTKIQTATENLLQEQKDEKTIMNKSLSTIESTVIDSVNAAKGRLDSLLVVFLKELKIIDDKTQGDLDSKLNLVEKLLNRIKDFVRITTFIRSYGSKPQLFIHLEKSEKEFNSEIENAVALLRQVSGVEASFLIGNSLQSLMEMQNLGELHVTDNCSKSVTKYEGVLSDNMSLPAGKIFDSIQLIKRKLVQNSGHDLKGGMCISDQIMVLCSSGMLIVTDILTGKIKTEFVLTKGPKRIAYDTENQTLYISCYSNYFYSVKFDQSFGKQTQLKNIAPYNGGVCIHQHNLYMVVGGEITKINLNRGSGLQTAFPTNTDCRDLNGLTIDHKKDRLIHTTKDFAVVCTSFDGKKIYSYKDDEMKKVTSVTVNSLGLIFAGDETGIVHLISEYGKQRRTLLDKCEKITRLCDIWVKQIIINSIRKYRSLDLRYKTGCLKILKQLNLIVMNIFTP
ncbi:transcription intermediary factor 1-alpha-like [Mytilus trossulus]|uniref:transcription intermediary factor 1-alpha-like n=1 Tax=Mytilus trossulus TaxID=6551 RepID=UPI0030061704